MKQCPQWKDELHIVVREKDKIIAGIFITLVLGFCGWVGLSIVTVDEQVAAIETETKDHGEQLRYIDEQLNIVIGDLSLRRSSNSVPATAPSDISSR